MDREEVANEIVAGRIAVAVTIKQMYENSDYNILEVDTALHRALCFEITGKRFEKLLDKCGGNFNNTTKTLLEFSKGEIMSVVDGSDMERCLA